jgi:hypothetical protein
VLSNSEILPSLSQTFLARLDSLANFETDIIPWKDPLTWLSANTNKSSAKQQISGGLSILVWAFPLASQDQTRHENAKSMNCAMLGIWVLMPLFKYNSNIDIG